MDRHKIILVVILVLAGGVRLWGLHISPPSLNWDEAALGYNAYSLWTTGQDEYGYRWPLSLRSFDDYKPPLYAYLTAPVVGIRGLNEFNTRFVSAVAGLGSVLLLYLITKKIAGEPEAIAAAGLSAINPWSIYFSRGAFEANLSLTLVLGIVYLVLNKKFLTAAILAGVNTLAYHSAKIYLWPILGWIGWKSRSGKVWLAMAAAIAIFSVPIWLGSGLARLRSTSILKLYRETGSIYLFTGEIVNRYLSYFSPANLFVRGSNEPNQKVVGFAPFYTWEVIVFVLGLGTILSKWQQNKFLLAGLAIAPLPAIITWSWFAPIRVLPLLAGITIVNAIGIVSLWKKSQAITAGVGAWAIVQAILFGLTIFIYSPYKDYGDWQWGFREVAAEIGLDWRKYDRIVWETGQAQPYIFVLYYLKIPPAEYHQLLPRRDYDFGKFEFRKIYWPDDQNLKNTLFIGGVYSLPEGKEVIDPQGYVSARIWATE